MAAQRFRSFFRISRHIDSQVENFFTASSSVAYLKFSVPDNLMSSPGPGNSGLASHGSHLHPSNPEGLNPTGVESKGHLRENAVFLW